jgi:hypothetical protein
VNPGNITHRTSAGSAGDAGCSLDVDDGEHVSGGLCRHRVAIVGLGPRGLYCLERLVAHFNASPLDAGLHIAVFNRTAQFGASPIYDPSQPEYLLVNIKVGEIDLWKTDAPAVVAADGSDFVGWYADAYPSREQLTGEEYLPRSVVGRYLVEGFQRIVGRLPAGVTLSCHVGEVVDIEPTRVGYVIAVSRGRGRGREAVRADKVMLATGHSVLEPEPQARGWAHFAGRHRRTRFIPFVYPVENQLADIAAGTGVAMLGLGLTFIDAALALTEGRGGVFHRDARGALRYSPSGREPGTILPFSRTGLPMSPKSADLPLEPRDLEYLTRPALDEMRRGAPAGKLDLDRDAWPLFELEMELRYYGVLQDGDPDWQRLDLAGGTPAGARQAVDGYLHARPQLARFDYRSILDPAAGRHFDGPEQFDRFVARYMRQQIALAIVGQQGSAVKAAIDIWYAARGVLGSALQYGGFTPESHRRLVEDVFPSFKRVGFGPPVVSIEKLAALHDAAVIDFSMARGSCVSMNEDEACFELRSSLFPGAVVRVESFVDARYPEVDVASDATPLLRSLRRRGTIKAFENPALVPGEPSYRPGAIDMTDPTRFVVAANGVANEDIAVIGIPTEGNLVGNLTLERDPFAGMWANQVMRQLRDVETARAASSTPAGSLQTTATGSPDSRLRMGASP